MTTVCIVGAGNLGGAVAHALARGDFVARVRLLDDAGGAAAGTALDIQQAGAIERFHTHIEGTADWSGVAGCTVCVVADRFGHSPAEWDDEAGLAMLRRLVPLLGEAPVVFAGAHQADLLGASVREAGLRSDRAIGSAPEALVAAIRAIVALEARCSPSEVALTVLGTPAGGFVVPWSDASIGGVALEHVLNPVQLRRIDARIPRLWPPGPYALGQAAAQVVAALVTSSRRSLTVLTVLRGEFGVVGRQGIVPAWLSTTGIVETRTPVLNTRERVRLEVALER